jgi:hypothetical protein
MLFSLYPSPIPTPRRLGGYFQRAGRHVAVAGDTVVLANPNG